MDGTSGTARQRLAVVTPSARSRPDFTRGMLVTRVVMLPLTSPERRAVIAGPQPSYRATGQVAVVRSLKSSAARWSSPPAPADAMLSLPVLEYSMDSLTLFAGVLGWAVRTSGVVPIRMMGVMPVAVLYGRSCSASLAP